jgi:hypothetical protein
MQQDGLQRYCCLIACVDPHAIRQAASGHYNAWAILFWWKVFDGADMSAVGFFCPWHRPADSLGFGILLGNTMWPPSSCSPSQSAAGGCLSFFFKNIAVLCAVLAQSGYFIAPLPMLVAFRLSFGRNSALA